MDGKYRKRIGFILTASIILLVLLFICVPKQNNGANALGSSSYVVYDVQDEKILLASNENERLPMASTTKIMTALLVVENCLPNEIVEIDDRAIGVEGSSVYLKKGERLTVSDLLYCMMLRSGNDSAVALALHVANSIEDFAEMMNARAEIMGLKNTHFVNPHGLHDDNHFTSASDLAIIAATAMRNNFFSKIVKTKSVIIGEGESTRQLTNKNKLLRLYNRATGIKTGYTKKSGRCLVSSATIEDRTLVCVVLNVGDTYGVSMRLLDEGFQLKNN